MSRRKSRNETFAVHEARGILFRLEVEQLGELLLHAGDVVIENFLGEELAFLCFAAGITDATGRAAGDGDGMMPGVLKTSQRQQGHEIADVQTVGGRIEATVKRDGRGEALGQFHRVRAIGDEAAPVQFIQDAHRRRD